MIKLIPYSSIYEEQTIPRIFQFFEFHQSLMTECQSTDDNHNAQDEESRRTLSEWLVHPNALFVLIDGDSSIGFIRICYRGSNVAWIEDIFVDADRRGQGIATSAIREVERIIADTPGYSAVCMDVSPHNSDALKLYHKLGYVDISLITIRKELGEIKRNKRIRIFGLDFNY